MCIEVSRTGSRMPVIWDALRLMRGHPDILCRRSVSSWAKELIFAKSYPKPVFIHQAKNQQGLFDIDIQEVCRCHETQQVQSSCNIRDYGFSLLMHRCVVVQ